VNGGDLVSAIGITLNLDETPWTDIQRADLVHITDPIRVGALPGGMSSGKASVAIAAFLPDGRPMVIELSLDHFLAAADALRARYGGNTPRGRDA
jgi:hypothetical protein